MFPYGWRRFQQPFTPARLSISTIYWLTIRCFLKSIDCIFSIQLGNPYVGVVNSSRPNNTTHMRQSTCPTSVQTLGFRLFGTKSWSSEHFFYVSNRMQQSAEITPAINRLASWPLNRQQFDCLFDSFFRWTTKKTTETYITGPLWRNPRNHKWILCVKGL